MLVHIHSHLLQLSYFLINNLSSLPQNSYYKRLPMHKKRRKKRNVEALSIKHLFIAGLIGVLLSVADLRGAQTTGECPRSTPDNEALKLLPCASAVQDVNTNVPAKCCFLVKNIGPNPKCLCAVLLSNLAKSASINPEIAITIPKRCNLKTPVGYKCGAYTLP